MRTVVGATFTSPTRATRGAVRPPRGSPVLFVAWAHLVMVQGWLISIFEAALLLLVAGACSRFAGADKIQISFSTIRGARLSGAAPPSKKILRSSRLSLTNASMITREWPVSAG